MADLTITVPDDLLQQARARADREGTSISAVLRAALTRYADDAQAGAAWDQFLDLAKRACGASAGGARKWTRDEVQRGGSA